jgi:hypothetical protein
MPKFDRESLDQGVLLVKDMRVTNDADPRSDSEA